MKNVGKAQTEKPWRPRLAFFALMLGIFACATTLALPGLEQLDRSIEEKSKVRVEKQVNVLGVSSKLKYVKTPRRGWSEQPFLVATIALILAGISASALSMRSLVAGRPTWHGAVGLSAGGGAIAMTLYFNPLAWIMFVLLIPALASILLGAAFVGVSKVQAGDGTIGLDVGSLEDGNW